MTLFELHEKRAHQFGASMITLRELMCSLEELKFAKDMSTKCENIPVLGPSVPDFEKEIISIEKTHQRMADLFEEHMGIDA